MSNHFSAANIKFPEDDARLDLTDLFVFAAPDSPDRTVLIIDTNPFMTGSEFHPDAVYRIHIDNDGDAEADVAFSFVFSQPDDGKQTATAYYATGTQARQPEPAGNVLISSTPVGFDAMARPVNAGRCDLEARPIWQVRGRGSALGGRRGRGERWPNPRRVRSGRRVG